MLNWEARLLSIGWLKRQAYGRDDTTAFGWLKSIGVVPEDVATRRTVLPVLDLDPNAVKAGYLASCAFEWDSWGTSRPEDFINAMEAETAGNERRDVVAGLLTQLGWEEIAA